MTSCSAKMQTRLGRDLSRLRTSERTYLPGRRGEDRRQTIREFLLWSGVFGRWSRAEYAASVGKSRTASVWLMPLRSSPKRNERYSISLSADPVSKYPTLKFETDYLNILSCPKRQGAHQVRNGFPFVVSGVQFMGTILRQPEGSNASHFVGLFTTARKGYFLSLNITAGSEQQVLERVVASIRQLTFGDPAVVPPPLDRRWEAPPNVNSASPSKSRTDADVPNSANGPY